jgi:hypothetical protein
MLTSTLSPRRPWDASEFTPPIIETRLISLPRPLASSSLASSLSPKPFPLDPKPPMGPAEPATETSRTELQIRTRQMFGEDGGEVSVEISSTQRTIVRTVWGRKTSKEEEKLDGAQVLDRGQGPMERVGGIRHAAVAKLEPEKVKNMLVDSSMRVDPSETNDAAARSTHLPPSSFLSTIASSPLPAPPPPESSSSQAPFDPSLCPPLTSHPAPVPSTAHPSIAVPSSSSAGSLLTPLPSSEAPTRQPSPPISLPSADTSSSVPNATIPSPTSSQPPKPASVSTRSILSCEPFESTLTVYESASTPNPAPSLSVEADIQQSSCVLPPPTSQDQSAGRQHDGSSRMDEDGSSHTAQDVSMSEEGGSMLP